MQSYQVVACAILVCMAISGTSGNYYNNYGASISKIVVYGKDKVVLPTMKNMLIVASELLEQSLKYAPKAIRYDLEDLVKRINYFSGDNKKVVALAESIKYKIQKGYIADCDYAKQLEESMDIIILLYKYCGPEYTYYNYNYKNRAIEQ